MRPLTRAAMSTAQEFETDLPELLWDLALVVVKPEALVSGRMNAVEPYPWVTATTDRIRLHILMSEGEPARCLLVRRLSSYWRRHRRTGSRTGRGHRALRRPSSTWTASRSDSWPTCGEISPGATIPRRARSDDEVALPVATDGFG
jgi:hypothetical protein